MEKTRNPQKFGLLCCLLNPGSAFWWLITPSCSDQYNIPMSFGFEKGTPNNDSTQVQKYMISSSIFCFYINIQYRSIARRSNECHLYGYVSDDQSACHCFSRIHGLLKIKRPDPWTDGTFLRIHEWLILSGKLPSLKLTVSMKSMDGWKTNYFPFGSFPIFSGANLLFVSGRVKFVGHLYTGEPVRPRDWVDSQPQLQRRRNPGSLVTFKQNELVVPSTHLKNMRKSNWVHLQPNMGWK